ncbi:MAG: stage II sporulation protein M [Candidatus Woesearchaeota archaeon]|nr:stage II sporulation protein M [Candidatus Woesearchaeota archaeon]
MVLESIKIKWIEHRPYIAFIFGILYTLIGYFAALIFFKDYVSIAMLFLSTLLVVPSLVKLLEIEEQRESVYGIRHFFSEHRDIVEAYVFLFIGVFVGYLILGFIISPANYSSVFQMQRDFLTKQEGLSGELINNFIDTPFKPSMSEVAGLVTNNLLVCIILFVLSFFYGAGAIFLIIFNASVFASFVTFVIEYMAQKASTAAAVIGVFSIHMLPEVTGFLLAAIAGGVVSKALMREKIRGKGFRNVMQDAIVLLLASCVMIVIAAFLEVFVTTYLFKMI